MGPNSNSNLRTTAKIPSTVYRQLSDLCARLGLVDTIPVWMILKFLSLFRDEAELAIQIQETLMHAMPRHVNILLRQMVKSYSKSTTSIDGYFQRDRGLIFGSHHVSQE